MKLRLKRTLLMVALALSGAAHAVTLGDARINSFLGEPLDVEIDIIGLAPGQHQDLRLRVANDADFKRLGITYAPYMSQLRFDVVQKGSAWVVRARSTRPISEPFVDFPLQMNWIDGRMIKHYTLLLDPPRRIEPVRVKRTTPPPARPAATPVVTQPAVDRSQAAARPNLYGPVRNGETLWPIAKRLKEDGITTRQMAMALLRANPDAFVGGNVNNLRAGVTLNVPSRAFVEELSPAEARAQFAAQSRQWRAPRETPSLAALPPVRPEALPIRPPVSEALPQSAIGPEPQPVEAPVAEDNAQLRIVTNQDKSDEPGSEEDLQKQLLVTMEEIESNRLATDAIESRLARMEAELQRMQQVIELKDRQISALQSEVATRDTARDATQVADPAPPALITPTLPDTEAETITPRDRDEQITERKRPAETPAETVVSVDAETPAPPASVIRPWYEQFRWSLWAIAAALGMLMIAVFMRRKQEEPGEVRMADLPEITQAPSRPYQPERQPTPEAIQEAAAELRELPGEEPPSMLDNAANKADLPELDLPEDIRVDSDSQDSITDSLLDEMLEQSATELLVEGKTKQDLLDAADTADALDAGSSETGISEDDIASWVAELGPEADPGESHSANDERLNVDEDIPSLLTELDDQLTVIDAPDTSVPSGIQLDPVDTIDDMAEDDTFTMSLDLARAYLEIGDQDGARDMLNQALTGARNPEHKRQIQELLQQIN